MQHPVLLGERGHFLLDVLESEDGFHLGAPHPVHALDDAPLQVHRESFVQPEVPPGRVRDQVARPGVRQLVRDERHQALVSREDRGGREGEPRILHPAEREARRQDEDVVPLPPVLPVQLLRRAQHRLEVRELARGAGDDVRLRPDARARRNRGEREVADRQGDQVRRDRLRHLEGVVPVARGRRVVVRAHDGEELLRRADARRVGDPHLRASPGAESSSARESPATA